MRFAIGAATLAWVGLATLAACDYNDPYAETIAWEAQLAAGISHPDLRGQAAVVSQLSGTDAGIGISGADSGAVYAWRVRLGTCSAPGDGIAPQSDYPLLTADERGDGSADTHLGPRLSREGIYHAEVRESTTDTSRVLCGDLQLR